MRLLIAITAATLLAIAEATYQVAPIYQYQGPAAPLSNDGIVIDTPEVAHARATHLALHAEAVARLRNTQNEFENPLPKIPMTQSSLAPLAPDGRVIDTPEVAQAKATHLAAHARAAAKASTNYEFDVYDDQGNLIYISPVTPVHVAYTPISSVGYRGPPAPLGPDGRVIDTPEVVRARDAHMKAVAHAIALTAHRENEYY